MSTSAAAIAPERQTRSSTKPPAVRRSKDTRRKARNSVIWSAISVVVFLFSIFPVYWMVNSSFLPTSMIRGSELHLWPGSNFTWRNYEVAIFEQDRSPFGPALQTSLLVTFFTLIFALLFAFLASIAISRFKFKGRYTFIITILAVQMIPAEAMMISIFRIIDSWQLLNTIVGLGMVYLAAVLPFTIWTLRGFVNAVPADLEEAAMIDGCSRTKAFWKVTFPLLAPGLVATGVFAFIQAWNEFVMALIIMTRPENMTLPVWLRTFQQATMATNWGALMAGATLIAIPVVIFFMIVQGRMTGGLVSGAVKG
ncbi:carbohydrate ABC transporter permease [Paraoerskovia marina]|uniref:Carbohydrate ABC transporter membrane protein 2, CUT1 family n=1 Tax=Paraoerskovia marina TaxID=545619 RepID=A0A1H1UEP1_9CELL|nr:carbohydrate ABC transporter membrane protein 2, CUT1 family [Paraoerskovia marina]